MRTTSSNAEHYITLWPTHAPREVLAISTWNVPDGGRLVREMRRVSQLRTAADVKRWVKKYPDVGAQSAADAINFLSQSKR